MVGKVERLRSVRCQTTAGEYSAGSEQPCRRRVDRWVAFPEGKDTPSSAQLASLAAQF